MNDFFLYLVTGLGFACIIESLPWLINPQKMRDFLLQLSETNPERLRYYGYFLLFLGVLFIWLARP